jgi:hypothetical protein
MWKLGTSLALMVILLVPSFVYAQTPKITFFDTFTDYKKGEHLLIFGQVADVSPELFVVIQVTNPKDELCRIQQLKPLPSGYFSSDALPLVGRICGVDGEYGVKVFYGESSIASSFRVLKEVHKEKSELDYVNAATNIVDSKINSIKGLISENQIIDFKNKLNQTKSSSEPLLELLGLHSDISSLFFDKDDLLDINPKFQPSIEAALESTTSLVDSGVLDSNSAKKINTQTYNAMFYSQIGLDKEAIGTLNDVYVQIANVNPQKIVTEQSLTYGQINELLLNLMTKSNSFMSRPVKEEIGFIFARGTGPLYTDDLENLVDMLTKGRTLDATLKRNDTLTSLIRNDWTSFRESLFAKESLVELLEKKDKVDKLYEAALLLRNLDRVDKFISADPRPELAVLIEPRLDNLLDSLQSAVSPDDIISVKQEILDMKNVIDISSRISSTIEFSKRNNADQKLITSFKALLDKVETANTLTEILQVISEFDNMINDLREKRSPLSVMKFEYEKLKTKAELQADYESLVTIKNALKAIDTAIEVEKGNSKINKIDKIEVLLSWASQNQPLVQAKLDSYTKDAYKIRASDILQRAKSLENLLDLGETRNRFLPGYSDFTDSMKERLDVARNLVVKNDLDAADTKVRQLFVEWQQVSQKYSEDPFGSETGYTGDEIQRIEYRKKIKQLSDFATEFYNADFEQHSSEFTKLKQKVYDLAEYGNAVDVDAKIKEIRNYLSDKLEQKNKKILFDISYNQEKQIWVMSGAVDKDTTERETLHLTVYDMEGKTHSTLEFSDTRQGDLFTQWYAPSEPGLYVVVLQWKGNQASQIVDVPEKTTIVYSNDGSENEDYARQFDELKSFVDAFGGTNYATNEERFEQIFEETTSALQKKDYSTASAKITELQAMIERYLPSRSKTAVIEAYVQDSKLYLSGAVYKTVAFSEDIYIDIFDQKGERIDEIPLKDTASGYFNQVINKPYAPGMYMAQLQYHELAVSDFFQVD